MATSIAPTRIPDTAATDLTSVLSKLAAVFAAASGLIHIAVVRHHLDYSVITAGFALMGSAQLLVAAGLLIKPHSRVRLAGTTLHAGILATWLLSRTVGLIVVRGAEEPVSFGFPDTIANLFGIAVIACLVMIELVIHRTRRSTLPAHTARGVIALIAVAAIALMVPAVSAPHAHTGHDHPAPSEPESGHDEAPTLDGHDDHAHDHG